METEKFLDVLNKELNVALGCTEPIAIAYGAALAMKYVKGEEPLEIIVNASGNVIKNAMAVSIPGTHSSGINLAAALGTLLNSHAGQQLEVLSGLKKQAIEDAKNMISEGLVTVNVSPSKKKLYIEVIVKTEVSTCRVVIEDTHTNVVLIEVDGEAIINKRSLEAVKASKVNYDFMNLITIWEFANNIGVEDLDIIRESIALNKAIATEGLEHNHGLSVGKNIVEYIERGLLADDIANRAMALTAAGSDARMDGANKSVMSNSGSGNQGILATVPVVAIGEKMGLEEEKIVKGVLISHLITIYIKSKFGVLSALCGATIAGTGASCGIAYLLGGDLETIEFAVQNMLGNVTGMVCDGAKAGCALKVSTCTNAAVQAALLAIEGLVVHSTEGIVEADPEKTIENVCQLANKGTLEVDKIILNIMLKKGLC